MRRTLTLLAMASVGVVGACKGGHHFDPPDQEARVLEAEGLYSSNLFDSITWASDSARALQGNAVFAAKCRKCHGPLGQGSTEYARARDLDVPSLVKPDWHYARSLDSVRHRVFVGHQYGMPNFGVAGISLREIDAAAFYLLNRLRPDVLQGEMSQPTDTIG